MQNKTDKTIAFWSSGKDSAFMVHTLLKDPTKEVIGLLTTIRETDHKINIHETNEEELDWQAKRLQIPLHKVFLPKLCPNTVYLERIHHKLNELKIEGLTHLAFGDLFLEDIRKFREENFQKSFQLLFPLWGKNTLELAHEIIDSGIKARLTAVDEAKLSKQFIARDFDRTLLKVFPKNVDPCGENGEFHTFVYDSPDFQR